MDGRAYWLPCTWHSQGCTESAVSPKRGRGFDKWGDSGRAHQGGQGLEHLRRGRWTWGCSPSFRRPLRDLSAVACCLVHLHREAGIRFTPKALLPTCEFQELAAGRLDVGPKDKEAALCAFSFSFYPYCHFSFFHFLCW